MLTLVPAPAPAPHRFRREVASWLETAGLILLIALVVFAVLGVLPQLQHRVLPLGPVDEAVLD